MAHRTLSVPSDTGVSTDLDAHVRKFLPRGSKLVKSHTYGTAAWTRASRIIVSLEDGMEKSYFLKCASEDVGKLMLEGEFDLLKKIGEYSPGLAPMLYGTGQFRDPSTPTYFLLMEFLDMDTGAPEPVAFMKQLAELHTRGVSPTGQFGYGMTTCQGPIVQDITWDDNWSAVYGRMMRQFHDREMATNGPSKDGKYEAEMEKLILLQFRIYLETGQAKIYDPAGFYAHNEYEFGMWRSENVPFGRPYYRQYFRYIPPSEPKEQWDDRNKLYSIKFEVTCSALWSAVHEGQHKMYYAPIPS
ncbi:hypothetical protein LTR27_012405 [Elasticomyces elasticus]|nr:hypothetical protein LTR27_012405 [Elasticomyces elasticus]